MRSDAKRVLYVSGDSSSVTPDHLTTTLPPSVDVRLASSMADAVAMLDADTVDAVVCEYDLDGSRTGFDVLAHVRDRAPDLPVILCTADPDGVVASEATRLGVTEYLPTTDPETVGDRLRAVLDAVPSAEATTEPDQSALRAIGDTISDFVVTIDSDSRIIYANASAPAVTGYDRQVLLGEPLTMIMPERFESLHQNAIDAYEETSERTVEWDYLELVIEHAEGHEVPVSVSLGEFTSRGEHYYTGIIRDISERKERESRLQESQEALHRLYEVTSAKDRTFDEKLDDLLELGCERLDLEYGYLNRVEDDTIRMVQSRGLSAFEGEEAPIEYAYCRETIDTDDLVTIPDTTSGKWAESKPTETFDIRCYLGGRVLLDGDLYGTLCFADSEARSDSFTDAQRTFVELIVQWLSYELERREHEQTLTSLLETTEALIQAPTRTAVAEKAAEASKEVLGFELNIVRLFDAETGTLQPTAMTDETRELLGERPVYEPGEGVPGEVYETGDPIYYHDRPIEVGADHDAETLCLPLGTHGTLTLSSHSIETFDRADRQVARLLAAITSAALSRADREAELARYEMVVESVQDMVFVLDEESRCTLVTRPLADRLGYDREELLGATLSTLLTPDDGSDLAVTVGDLLADTDRETAQIEAVVRTNTGQQFPAIVDLSSLPGDRFQGAVGVIQDRTELAEARSKLEDERDRFSYLFENLPDAVVEVEVVDDVPEITSTNRAFEDVFGWESAAVIGESLTDLIVPKNDRETGAELARKAANGEVVQREVRRHTANGIGYFLFRGIPYDVDNDRTRAFGIYTDITEQRSRQRQLQVLNRVFRHNLRNDLTVILGVTNHLRGTLEDPELLDLLDTLLSKANGLSEMSETVRHIEQTVSRSTESVEVDASALIEEVVTEYRMEYPDADITVEVPDSLTVVADEHLQKALDHLLENALKHVESGTPVVECTLSIAEDEPEQATVAVTDNGPGIPEPERVVAADQEIDQLNHASGLGLWLVRWIVDSYGGTLSMADRPEGGSEVRITVPLAEDEIDR